MVLFGDVGEVQEVRERACQRDGGLNRQRTKPLCEIRQRPIARVRGLRQGAHVLDDVEQVLAAAFTQRIAQQRAKQTHILPQRFVRVRRWVA